MPERNATVAKVVRVIVGDLGRAAGTIDGVVKRLLRESLEHTALGRAVFGVAGRGYQPHHPLGHLDPARAVRLRPLPRETEAGTGHVDVALGEPENVLRPHRRLLEDRERHRRSTRDALEDGEEVRGRGRVGFLLDNLR
jgi:hypothetical protein